MRSRPREIFDTVMSLVVIGMAAVLLWQGRGHWMPAQAAISTPARVQSEPAYTMMTWGAGPVVTEICEIGAMSFVVCAECRPALRDVASDESPVVEVKVKGKPDIKDTRPPVRKKVRERKHRRVVAHRARPRPWFW